VLASFGGKPASSAHIKQASEWGLGALPHRHQDCLAGATFVVVRPNQTCHDSIR
jgi:hypothetical protein